jgi:hypothetical protein
MRKIFFTFFAVTFALLSGVAATNALAKPVGSGPVQFTAAGTFSNGPGEAGIPFPGTLSESADPGAARELCRVVRTATRNSSDQGALARVLNKVL